MGGLANSLMRHSDRVKLACLAQLVNVIAPIMTNENGILRNTIYYPYAWALKHGHGDVLDTWQTGPSYEVATLGRPIEAVGLPAPGFGQVPYLDVVITRDKAAGTATVFVLNRDLEKPRELELVWHDLTPTSVVSFETLTGKDLKAGNTFADPNKVVPAKLDAPKAGSRMTVELPAGSHSVLTVAV